MYEAKQILTGYTIEWKIISTKYFLHYYHPIAHHKTCTTWKLITGPPELAAKTLMLATDMIVAIINIILHLDNINIAVICLPALDISFPFIVLANSDSITQIKRY